MSHDTARTAAIRVLLMVILGSLPACSLGRTSPTMEQYVIGGGEVTASTPPITGVEAVTVGVRRLDLADYLASPGIVVRRGAHEIVMSDFHRWGEDPADGINRAVARHLAAAAPFRVVDVAPWPVRSRYDYLIQLHVTRFEGAVPAESSAPAGAMAGAVDGAVHVRASWEIIRQEDGTVLARGATEHREDGWRVGDYAALVAKLDEGLAAVARQVAVAVGGLAAGGPSAAGPSGR